MNDIAVVLCLVSSAAFVLCGRGLFFVLAHTNKIKATKTLSIGERSIDIKTNQHKIQDPLRPLVTSQHDE